MAVFDILPENNLRAEDIRDTLLANGADWSNEVVKNANYLPNYFKKGAKINMYSKRKPTECGNKLDYAPTDWFENVQYGIVLKKYRYSDRNQFYTDYINGICDIKIEEPKVKRLSDFCGYFPGAINPVFVDQLDEIVTVGKTEFEIDINGGTVHNVGFYDIYPEEYRHLGVRVSFENHVFWTSNPIDWENPSIPKPVRQTDGEIFEFMCTGEFLSTGGTVSDHISMMPIIIDNGNPHKVKFIPRHADNLIINAQFTWYDGRPSQIDPTQDYRCSYEIKYINNKITGQTLGSSSFFWVIGDDVVGSKGVFNDGQVDLAPSGENGDRITFYGDFFVKGDPRNYTYEVRCNGIVYQTEFMDEDIEEG